MKNKLQNASWQIPLILEDSSITLFSFHQQLLIALYFPALRAPLISPIYFLVGFKTAEIDLHKNFQYTILQENTLTQFYYSKIKNNNHGRFKKKNLAVKYRQVY